MRVRFIPFLGAAALAIAALDACGDVTGIKAQFENVDRPDVLVYAMNGSDPSLPSALLLRAVSAVPITSEFNFDVALDLDNAGNVVLHTVKSVVSEFIPAHRVGLDTTATPFEQVTSIRGSAFVYDSSLTVPVGRTVLIDVLDPSCNIYSILGQNIRAKLLVDSVKVAQRQIYLHLFVDPNCGFRSLAPGTPKE